MRAMIMAAGRGERMRPLTDHLPKPLLEVNQQPLISYHLARLAKAGIHKVVINLAYRGQQIRDYVGTGQPWGLQATYSPEPQDALDSGGGIYQALPLLGNQPFVVLNSDIWTDYDYRQLPCELSGLAHLVLTPVPDYYQQGDFGLQSGRVTNHAHYTFTGVRVLHPKLFAHCKPGRFSLVPLLRQAADQGLVSGECYQGHWRDIGTPQRLQQLRDDYQQQCLR